MTSLSEIHQWLLCNACKGVTLLALQRIICAQLPVNSCWNAALCGPQIHFILIIQWKQLSFINFQKTSAEKLTGSCKCHERIRIPSSVLLGFGSLSPKNFATEITEHLCRCNSHGRLLLKVQCQPIPAVSITLCPVNLDSSRRWSQKQAEQHESSQDLTRS